MRLLVTGAAGFIGMHCCERLLALGNDVIGVDNLIDYYDVRLKQARLNHIEELARKNDWHFKFIRMDIADWTAMSQLFAEHRPQRVVSLAAQPGVRYSVRNPHAYVNCNLAGFLNVLEGCRQSQVEHLVYASSSSVYGANTKMPFSTHNITDHPVSLYGATKKANELMAHSYSHVYGLPTTGLRFFTVYGPWGRPDMAPTLFASAILHGTPINVFNNGKMRRDFTYIDDIVEGVVRILKKIPAPDPTFDRGAPDSARSHAPYRIYNIGNNNPVELMQFIETIEDVLGKIAQKNLMPMQLGDVEATYADIDDLTRAVGFRPDTPLIEGVKKFIAWHLDYYEKEHTKVR